MRNAVQKRPAAFAFLCSLQFTRKSHQRAFSHSRRESLRALRAGNEPARPVDRYPLTAEGKAFYSVSGSTRRVVSHASSLLNRGPLLSVSLREPNLLRSYDCALCGSRGCSAAFSHRSNANVFVVRDRAGGRWHSTHAAASLSDDLGVLDFVWHGMRFEVSTKDTAQWSDVVAFQNGPNGDQAFVQIFPAPFSQDFLTMMSSCVPLAFTPCVASAMVRCRSFSLDFRRNRRN